MSAVLVLVACLAAGAALGVAFFGGLRLTVEGLVAAPQPGLRMLASLLARFGLALAGFYALARLGDWQHVAAGLLGFTLARVALVANAARRGRDTEADA